MTRLLPLPDLLPDPTPDAAGRRPIPPLDLAAMLGPVAWRRLPATVRRRFVAGHAAAVYEGRMDLRCSMVGRWLARLARPLRGPLIGDNASDVPVTVRVHADGLGGVVWTRRLGAHTVVSVKSAHPDGGVFERAGGGLAMALDVLEDDGALVFCSRHFAWCLGPLYLRVPNWLTPGQCRVEHRDLGDGRFRFTLSMTHPLWGETFHQTGVFSDPAQE